MYDSVAGRFCSRDPIGYVDGMSLYRGYFILNGMDPSGEFLFVLPAAIPGVIIGAGGVLVVGAACYLIPGCYDAALEAIDEIVDTIPDIDIFPEAQPPQTEPEPETEPRVDIPGPVPDPCPRNLRWPYCGRYECPDGSIREAEFDDGAAPDTSPFTVDDPDGPYEADCVLVEEYNGECLGW
jgi:hypothetical protein